MGLLTVNSRLNFWVFYLRCLFFFKDQSQRSYRVGTSSLSTFRPCCNNQPLLGRTTSTTGRLLLCSCQVCDRSLRVTPCVLSSVCHSFEVTPSSSCLSTPRTPRPSFELLVRRRRTLPRSTSRFAFRRPPLAYY